MEIMDLDPSNPSTHFAHLGSTSRSQYTAPGSKADVLSNHEYDYEEAPDVGITEGEVTGTGRSDWVRPPGPSIQTLVAGRAITGDGGSFSVGVGSGQDGNPERACGCDPCECDVDLDSEIEPGKADDGYHGVDEFGDCIPSIIDPPIIDPYPAFVQKLQDHLNDIRHEYCHKTHGKPAQFNLSTSLIKNLLIEHKDSAKIYCFLPGNELYPALLKHRVNDKDICNICAVLAKKRTVSSINLAYNDIGDHGLKRLAHVIKASATVAHVNLMHNNFTAEGLLHLVQALLKRNPLQSLRLTGVKFGDEGIDALTCLILSGKVPLDLDVGECDLSVAGFQTLCTALYALDHDINVPAFLRKRKLPIDLETLSSNKEQYNEEAQKMSAMEQDDVMTALRWANVRQQDKTKFKPNQQWAWDGYQISKTGMQHQDEGLGDQVPAIFQEFSATVLQGLFDVGRKLGHDSGKTISASGMPYSQQTVLAPPSGATAMMGASQSQLDLSTQIIEKSWQISEQANQLGSLDEYIDQYKAEENQTVDEKNYYLYPVVSPSLYKLDYDNAEELLSEFTYEIDNPENEAEQDADFEEAEAKMQMYHGQVIDMHQPILKHSVDEAEGADEYTANEAARLAAQQFIKSAADAVGASDVMSDKTDVIQLLYMALLDIARMRGPNFVRNDHTVGECKQMMDFAVEHVQKLLMSQIPENCVELNEEIVKTFVRNLVETASETFLKLLNNDRIAEALGKAGTLACRQATTCGQEQNTDDGTWTEEQIRHVAMQFLNGAIEEAGRLIGTGDPFGFHTKHAHIHAHGHGHAHGHVRHGHGHGHHDQHEHEHELDQEQKVHDVETGIGGAIDNLFELGGALAASAKEDAKELHEAEKLYQEAANEFVESLFGDVRAAVEDYMELVERPQTRDETDKEALMKLKYSHISRPTRLVLNRPFFHHYEDLMGSKLGEYVAGNHTLKALHIQKWGLGEEGMLNLMDGLSKNKTLRTLDLSCNNLGADGMKPLGSYLATNKNLKHLVLNHNGLKDPGIINLIAHITESNIESLHIAHNDITWIGLDRLLRVIPATKIHALYLWGNKFGLETWQLFHDLRADGIIKHSDTLLQQVDDETFCIVRDAQARDTGNEYYDVAPQQEGLSVPPYITDRVHASNYEEPQKY